MDTYTQIEAIEARKKEMETDIAVRQEVVKELSITIKVLRQFSQGTTPPPAPPSPPSPPSSIRPARPDDLPSLFEMTESVLEDVQSAGGRSPTAAEIVEAIGIKYWPGVTGRQILPSIYQYAKKGRLVKSKSGRFTTVKRIEAPPS